MKRPIYNETNKTFDFGSTRHHLQCDPIWAKYDDEYVRQSGSYPSGHTAIGWFTALAFAEMWPALQDDILRRGFMFGESRVIVG